MLNFTITPENHRTIDNYKNKLIEAFPDKNSDDIYKILNSYDSAYLSAREYFAYYFPMTTKTVIDYINNNKLGNIWQFTTDAIFDEGINSLYSLIDNQSNKYRNVLKRSEEILGFPISDYDKNKEYIKRINLYRNNRSAHFGKGYFEKNTSIRYEDPIIMLEHLRRDRNGFNRQYLGLIDLIYDELKIYFIEKIPIIIKMLNVELDTNRIKREMAEYLDSVIGENFKKIK